MKLTETDLNSRKVFWSVEYCRTMWSTRREAEQQAREYGNDFVVRHCKDRFGVWCDDKAFQVR